MALGMQHHDQASSMEKRILRITLTSDLLEKHSREIRVLALKKQVVYGLLKYLSDSFRTMQADYKEIIRMVEGCVEKVQQLLDDNGGKELFLVFHLSDAHLSVLLHGSYQRLLVYSQ
jgi:hypothetical protein